MHAIGIAPIVKGAVFGDIGDDALFNRHTEAQDEGDLHALRHGEQFGAFLHVEGFDDAAAEALAVGRKLDGLNGNARVVEDEFSGVLGHEHGYETRGALAFRGSAPVLQGAGPFGERKERVERLAGLDGDETQFLLVTGGGSEPRAFDEPVKVLSAQGSALVETSAGAGLLDKFSEIAIASHRFPPVKG